MTAGKKFALMMLLLAVTFPLALILQYMVLARVGATDLMWFLFWFNVPISIAMRVVCEIAVREKP